MPRLLYCRQYPNADEQNYEVGSTRILSVFGFRKSSTSSPSSPSQPSGSVSAGHRIRIYQNRGSADSISDWDYSLGGCILRYSKRFCSTFKLTRPVCHDFDVLTCNCTNCCRRFCEGFTCGSQKGSDPANACGAKV